MSAPYHKPTTFKSGSTYKQYTNNNTNSNNRPPQTDQEKLYIRISKFLALTLRHEPHAAGLVLSKDGWGETSTLLASINSKFGRDLSRLQTGYTTFTAQHLSKLVQDCPKKRYQLSEDGTKIRASQGHSLSTQTVDLGFVALKPEELPEILYHGTSSNAKAAILKSGLLPMSRQYVHLSGDLRTAISVGRRHLNGGELLIFAIEPKSLVNDGIEIYKSDNGVFLSPAVPEKYLKVVDPTARK